MRKTRYKVHAGLQIRVGWETRNIHRTPAYISATSKGPTIIQLLVRLPLQVPALEWLLIVRGALDIMEVLITIGAGLGEHTHTLVQRNHTTSYINTATDSAKGLHLVLHEWVSISWWNINVNSIFKDMSPLHYRWWSPVWIHGMASLHTGVCNINVTQCEIQGDTPIL